ncbi:hypothetical protein [Cryobacterium tagatosivorans]|uniref:DUF559 domain-containing protein n=1 Tax=Cryobacterium tagatosivorans TaxID=1259199 RepID=A0A4V6QG42_9MICO|nr:hypothetical protein [Cryobacterium tagatosivorans]TFB56670.1 hypothetical protein E3O23_00150 [Cryobacterium tagatosivorans]
MRNRTILPVPLRGRAFLTTDVPPETLGRGRLLAPDVQRPSRGVRAIDLDFTAIHGRCEGYLPRMPAGQAFSHVTAAQLYLIPLPPFLAGDQTIHVAVNERRQPPRVVGVVGHALGGIEAAFREHHGFVVTDPVSTWCQLSTLLTLYDLIAAGDFLVSGRVTDAGREPPLATIAELRAGVLRHSGRRGAKNLREAIGRVRTGVDSRPETWLRLILVDDGLPEPVVNEAVFDGDGRRLGKPDLAYPWARLLFEYEGDGHRVSKERFRGDITRRETFEADRWRVIRVVPDDVFTNRRAFLNRVRRVLAQQTPAKPQ